MHEEELINLAIVAGAALLCGLLFSRIRQPVVVGYIVAGVVLGPSVLGLVGDGEEVQLVAELGVLMLLFLIGMELSLRSFRRIWRTAMTIAGLQIGLGLAFAWLFGKGLGWSPELSLIVGFGLGLSSTAVAIKILEDIGELRSDVGQLAVGVLVAQDLAVVPMLLIVSEMGKPDASPYGAVVPVLVAVAILGGIVFLLSRRKREHLPFAHWISDNHDLAAMSGLAMCFVFAAISGLVGLSPAYGAFIGGLVVGNTIERQKMIAAVEPVQSVLLMVFFLSIGLLLDLNFIWENMLLVIGLLLAVSFAKIGTNIIILRMLGEPWPKAWLAGTVIGQVGEFSFVLVATGVAAGVVDPFGSKLMTAIIALSLIASPFFLFTARRMEGVEWRRVRTFSDFTRAIYGRNAGAFVQGSGRAARGVGRVTLSVGDYGINELDRIVGRLQPRKPETPVAAAHDEAMPEAPAPDQASPEPEAAAATDTPETSAAAETPDAADTSDTPPDEAPRDGRPTT
ncbi:MAG: cation:proton antiporter [Minwuia sp.]|nr:cation:proton antiporter [Minwuia sp.]